MSMGIVNMKIINSREYQDKIFTKYQVLIGGKFSLGSLDLSTRCNGQQRQPVRMEAWIRTQVRMSMKKCCYKKHPPKTLREQ